MTKSNRAEITYLKDNRKITTKLYWYNKTIILNKLFPNRGNIIQIPEDIKWIHFKNCKFQDLDKKDIKISSNKTCIFENCTFSNDRMLSRNLFISGGKIELINPNFINIDALFIKNKSDYLQNNEGEWNNIYEGEVTIKFSKKCSEKLDYLEVVADKVNITNNDGINDLHIRGNIINLNKKFNLEHCGLEGNKVFIGNKEELNTTISVQYPTINIRVKEKLSLINSILKASESVTINSLNHLKITNPKELELENTTIKSKKIIIGEKIHYLANSKTYATTKELKKDLEKVDDNLYSKSKSIKSKSDLQKEEIFESTLNNEFLEQTTTSKRKR